MLLLSNHRQQMDLMLLHVPQKQVAALKEAAAGGRLGCSGLGGRGWGACCSSLLLLPSSALRPAHWIAYPLP